MTTALITGSTDGIGLQTARDLAARGVDVILHGRSPAKLAQALQAVREVAPEGQHRTCCADLGELAQVRRLADEVGAAGPLEILIHNAGVYMNQPVASADGFELTFAVNHLAPFLLTHLLLPQLQAAAAGRIVVVSSVAHLRGRLGPRPHLLAGFDAYGAYACSKLANVVFTVELAQRLAGSPSCTVNALHPGVVSTKLLREGFGFSGPDSLEEGAATSVYLATSPEVAQVSGGYFARSRPAPMNPDALEPAVRAQLWDLSAALTGVG